LKWPEKFEEKKPTLKSTHCINRNILLEDYCIQRNTVNYQLWDEKENIQFSNISLTHIPTQGVKTRFFSYF
jgi:hypothetical protein